MKLVVANDDASIITSTPMLSYMEFDDKQELVIMQLKRRIE